MRILHLEPIGGASGDMMLGALVDLGVPLEVLEGALGTLGVPGWRLAEKGRDVGSIAARKVDVVLDAPEHVHRHLSDVTAIIEASKLTRRAKAIATEAFRRLAVAEGKVHGVDPEAVHFHEVGAVDAIVDICGTAVAVDHLAPERITAAPPPLGSGFVTAAHGRIPVPVPAVLELMKGLPVARCETEGELTTPTGAALLATLADAFGPVPAMTLEAVGYGAGDATWPDRPNVLRAILGTGDGAGAAQVLVVETNLDDMSPELVADATAAILSAGALDVVVIPVVMKKGRPGHLLQALCRDGDREKVVDAILQETTSFGVRLRPAQRVELDRAFVTVSTPFGEVRVKVGRRHGEVLTASPEHADCVALAEAAGVPVREVHAAAAAAYRACYAPAVE